MRSWTTFPRFGYWAAGVLMCSQKAEQPLSLTSFQAYFNLAMLLWQLSKKIKRTGSSEGLWGQPKNQRVVYGQGGTSNKALSLLGLSSFFFFFTANSCHILIKADISMSAILIKLPNPDIPLVPCVSTFRGDKRKWTSTEHLCFYKPSIIWSSDKPVT